MKAAPLLRILACVALVVSGLPVWAVVCRAQAEPSPVRTTLVSVAQAEASACGMACCAERPTLDVPTCCPAAAGPTSEDSVRTATSSEHHALSDAGCAVDVPTGVPSDLLASAAPVLVQDLAVLNPPAAVLLPRDEAPVPLRRLRVGIVGHDAGPPPDVSRLPESGRAPPFARV